MDLYTLSQVKGRRLTIEEKQFIKKHVPKKKFLVKYCIWKQNRINGAYIMLIIDKLTLNAQITNFLKFNK